MKKYKLIKKYPGSPSLGTDITIDEKGYNSLHCDNDLKPEDHPEFWEEVKKDYEILSFLNVDNEGVYRLNNSVGYLYEGSFRKTEFCLQYYKIHSV